MYIYFAQVYNISLPNVIIWVQIRGIDCRGERVYRNLSWVLQERQLLQFYCNRNSIMQKSERHHIYR